MAHFIPCKITHDASYIVGIFFEEIVRLHGLPLSIIFDKDPIFLRYILRTLWRKLGTSLCLSSAYHPQYDGKTKAIIKSLGNHLRCLTKKHDTSWDSILAQVELSYNEFFNRSARMNPFQIVHGRHPKGVLELRDVKNIEKVSAQEFFFVEVMRDIYQ